MTQVKIADKTLELCYANSMTYGYGHKSVMVQLYYNGMYKDFAATTNRVDLTDDASELEGDERYLALYNIIDGQIEHLVIDWIEELDNN